MNVWNGGPSNPSAPIVPPPQLDPDALNPVQKHALKGSGFSARAQGRGREPLATVG